MNGGESGLRTATKMSPGGDEIGGEDELPSSTSPGRVVGGEEMDRGREIDERAELALQ